MISPGNFRGASTGRKFIPGPLAAHLYRVRDAHATADLSLSARPYYGNRAGRFWAKIGSEWREEGTQRAVIAVSQESQ